MAMTMTDGVAGDRGTAGHPVPPVADDLDPAEARRRIAELTLEVAQLHEAMASRATIEQAKGMIMREQRCSAADAFDILRRWSMNENRKLREVAEEIVARATT